ncbi:MAG: hypothetical protein PHT07_07210 [Paludibacter sp.]|nr:hypothetical protein [Paludibacter sp.]
MTDPDENIKQHIREQITFNSGKNLMSDDQINSLQLIQVTESLVEKIQQLDAESEKEMIDFLTDEALQEFCRVNQYFAFNAESVVELKDIYRQLNQNIKSLPGNTAQETLNTISEVHYRNLCDWLVHTNAFAGTMYSNDQKYAKPVACSEYTPDLQLNILQIDLKKLKVPVLDIGCGREMNLVNYLRDHGIEAFGIDRFDNDNPYYTKTDWLEYAFEPDKWGSIISNLGFSNHFIHHNLRSDGNYREYALKYMEILGSMKTGGTFYYAPDLPFIEMHLERTKYRHTGYSIQGSEFKASRIERIS